MSKGANKTKQLLRRRFASLSLAPGFPAGSRPKRANPLVSPPSPLGLAAPREPRPLPPSPWEPAFPAGSRPIASLSWVPGFAAGDHPKRMRDSWFCLPLLWGLRHLVSPIPLPPSPGSLPSQQAPIPCLPLLGSRLCGREPSRENRRHGFASLSLGARFPGGLPSHRLPLLGLSFPSWGLSCFWAEWGRGASGDAKTRASAPVFQRRAGCGRHPAYEKRPGACLLPGREWLAYLLLCSARRPRAACLPTAACRRRVGGRCARPSGGAGCSAGRRCSRAACPP